MNSLDTVSEPSTHLLDIAHSRPPRAAQVGEFAGYFVASALALGLDFAVLTALVEWAHWSPLIATSAGFVAGTLVAFILSSRWVFRQHSYSHWSAGLVVFGLIGVSGLLVNLMLIWLGTEALGWDYRIAKLGAAGGSFLFNFCARKLALFNRNVGVTA